MENKNTSKLRNLNPVNRTKKKQAPQLSNAEKSKLWEILDDYGLDRIKSYSLPDNTKEVMINYFKLMYKSCDKAYILEKVYDTL